MTTMANAKIYIFHLILLCLYAGVKSASVAIQNAVDGFTLNDFVPGKTFSYGVVPKTRGQEMTLNFVDAAFSSTDCGDFRVDVYDDGYVKLDFNRIAVFCDKNSLKKFTATSTKGFYVVVTMGANTNGGTLKTRFDAGGGITITNEVLY